MKGLPKRRLLAELRALLERFPSLRRRPSAEGALVFEVSLEIDDETRHVRLTLPPAYPEVPPEVRELAEPGGAAIVPVGGMHRFSSGVVCLFTHGNDSQVWHQDRLAAEALERFVELVGLERAKGPKKGGTLLLDRRKVFVPAAIIKRMCIRDGWGFVEVCGSQYGLADRFVDVIKHESPPFPSLHVPLGDAWDAIVPLKRWVPWIHVDLGDAGSLQELLALQDGGVEALVRAFIPASVIEQHLNDGIIIAGSGGSKGFEAIHVMKAGGLLIGARVLDGSPSQRLFNRVDGVMHKRRSIAKTRVVMVGLGSLGGAVALALARARIERFVLIDPDTLSIENVCRHVAPISLVGLPKVSAVELMLRGVNPEVKVTAIPKHLAWDLPYLGAGKELAEMLSAGDVVVCTCAVGPAERQLNALAVRRRVPVIFGAALGAAEHARVFRVIAGESACYECVMRAQERDPERFPCFVAEDAPEHGEAYMDPSLPGLAIDVTQIAMLIARLALQTIARTTKADLGIGDERGHHLLWSNRGGWADCDRSLQVAVRDVPLDPACPVCGAGREEAAMSEPEAAELAGLLAKIGG